MREEIHILSRLKGYECLQSSHRGSHKDKLTACVRVQLALEDLGAHLAYIELIDSLHLEGSAIQAAVLPLEFGGSGVILGIVFTPSWQAIDVEVFKFVDCRHCVLVKHTEACCPSLKDVISKDVELSILGLILEHMNAFGKISGEDATAFFDLNVDDRRSEVLVLLLTEKLFLAELVDSQDVADTSDESTRTLVEGVWDIFAWSAV